MTGPFSVSPSAALDIVKLDGLIPVSKQPYLPALAFGRPGDLPAETFFAGARSISSAPGRRGDPGRRVDVQEGVWIR
jgi:hypothetical protein